MSYSIKPIISSYKNNAGLQKVAIRVIYNRKKYYAETDIKVLQDQFKDGVIKKHVQALVMNGILRQRISDIETRLLAAIQNKKLTDKLIVEIIKGKVSESVSVESFKKRLVEQLKGRVSDNRIRHLKSVLHKFTSWQKLTFNSISVDLLNDFEAHIRKSGIQGNTIFANMKMLKSFLIKAKDAGLVKEEQYKAYKVPSYSQNIPVYLNEKEIDSIYELVKVIQKPGIKTVGYYFLLSCYAGYRISDLMRFDYSKMIHGNSLALRAKKNGEVVSIAVYLKLERILEYVKDNKLKISEQHFRNYLNEIVLLAGINKKVTPHTGRHSFAMLLMSKGFTIDEVAELLGDSELIAKVYARITNEHLNKKVMERLN